MPPTPKDPATRRRRNKSTTRAALRPVDPKAVKVPPLPEIDDWEWHPVTVAWWSDIWHSPMSAEWDLLGDLHQLYVLAMLVDQFWDKPTPSLAAEIRQARQAFGLTPLDRRRLEWTIEKAEEAKSSRRGAGGADGQPKRRGRKGDPRSTLSVVK